MICNWSNSNHTAAQRHLVAPVIIYWPMNTIRAGCAWDFMTVPSHPVQGINRICFGMRLGRLAWPRDRRHGHRTTRWWLHGRRECVRAGHEADEICSKKPRGPQQRGTVWVHTLFFFFFSIMFMFSASRFPSTEKTVMRKVRPKTSWPSGLVRRTGAALQTHSGKEGGEKDKHCQDRNKVHQYLITGVFYLRSGAAERWIIIERTLTGDSESSKNQSFGDVKLWLPGSLPADAGGSTIMMAAFLTAEPTEDLKLPSVCLELKEMPLTGHQQTPGIYISYWPAH